MEVERGRPWAPLGVGCVCLVDYAPKDHPSSSLVLVSSAHLTRNLPVTQSSLLPQATPALHFCGHRLPQLGPEPVVHCNGVRDRRRHMNVKSGGQLYLAPALQAAIQVQAELVTCDTAGGVGRDLSLNTRCADPPDMSHQRHTPGTRSSHRTRRPVRYGFQGVASAAQRAPY